MHLHFQRSKSTRTKTALAPPGLPINLSLERWFVGGNLVLLRGKELIRCFKGLYLLIAFTVLLKDVVCVLHGHCEDGVNLGDSGRLPFAGEGGHLLYLVLDGLNG